MEEENFWWGRDMATGEELELGPPPPRVQLEEVGWWIPWVLAEEPAEEGSPLLPLGPGPIEVDGAKQAPGDSAAVGKAADKETNSSLAHDSLSLVGQLWAGPLFVGVWCPVGEHVGLGRLHCGTKQTD